MSMRPDLAARVAAVTERVEGEVESWNPRAEPSHPRMIAGELLERRVRPGRGFEGADAETALIRTVEGKLWLVWLFATVLQQEFAGLEPGDVVAVKYEGHVDGGRGRSGYEHYRVSVDQRSSTSSAPTGPEGSREAVCEACGFPEGDHAAGCPNEIPY
jgi:hypothetical protein